MKISLYSTKKFVAINQLPEVTNSIIFDFGGKPTSNGLLSFQIFGNTSYERKTQFAYIDLHGHFLNPFIFKLLKRVDRKFESIVNGSKTYVIKDNYIVEDENGETGLEWLYKNWNKIKFPRNDSSIRNERIDVLENHTRDEIFQEYAIVSPPFYRDVNMDPSGNGKVRPHVMTKFYSNLIGYSKALEDSNTFEIVLNNTRARIQYQLVEIYDYYKGLIEKKYGLIRKNLLGKSVDYGQRSVITAPVFQNANKPDEMLVDFGHAGIPLAQVCSMMAPFIIAWVKRFFETEMTKIGSKYPVERNGEIKYYKIKKPELYFNEAYIKKHLDRFIRSDGDRFEKIEIPLEDADFDTPVYMVFRGRYYQEGVPESESPIANRFATWTDIFYQAAYEESKNKIAWISRYPLLDYFGTYPTEITILSTKKTIPVYIGGTLYKNYPDINLDIPKEKVNMEFIDTISMSNTLLQGLGGDYDGDQVSARIMFSQQACEEGRKLIYSKKMLLNMQGGNARPSNNEVIQTLYMITRTADE